MQNAIHVYTTSGSFNISLKVANSDGCTKTVTKTQYIKIGEGVKASFSTNASELCAAPATIQFNNNSEAPATNYVWNFGDGTTSSAINPSHTYNANGSYTVTLVAVNAKGCKDTLRKQNLINLGTNHSDFSVSASVCAGESVSFTNTSSPLPSLARWSFGDGGFSDSLNSLNDYVKAGNYTVKLVNDFNGCKDSICRKKNFRKRNEQNG